MGIIRNPAFKCVVEIGSGHWSSIGAKTPNTVDMSGSKETDGHKRKSSKVPKVHECSRRIDHRPANDLHLSTAQEPQNTDDADLENRKNAAIAKLQALKERCYALKIAAVDQSKDEVAVEAARRNWVGAIKRQKKLEDFRTWDEEHNYQPVSIQTTAMRGAERTSDMENISALRSSGSIRNDSKKINRSVRAPQEKFARDAPPSSTSTVRNKEMSNFETKLLTDLNETSSQLRAEMQANGKLVRELRMSYQKASKNEALYQKKMERAKEDLRLHDESLQGNRNESLSHIPKRARASLD